MAMNPADVAQRWANNLSAAGQKIKDGVNAVTESPMAKAAARQDAWVQGVQRARDDGSYAAGLNKVSLSDWKTAMINKGIPRIGTGATSAVPKMTSFMASFLPYVQQGQQMLQSMPRGDLSQNIGRMTAMVQYLANYKNKS